MELKWNDILTGTPGKVTSAQDAVQDLIPYENETYIAPQNGNDITLTIDANIQQIAEKYLKDYLYILARYTDAKMEEMSL